MYQPTVCVCVCFFFVSTSLFIRSDSNSFCIGFRVFHVRSVCMYANAIQRELRRCVGVHTHVNVCWWTRNIVFSVRIGFSSPHDSQLWIQCATDYVWVHMYVELIRSNRFVPNNRENILRVKKVIAFWYRFVKEFLHRIWIISFEWFDRLSPQHKFQQLKYRNSCVNFDSVFFRSFFHFFLRNKKLMQFSFCYQIFIIVWK